MTDADRTTVTIMTHEEEAQFKEAYTLYDTEKKGNINASHLLGVMRMFKSDPTESEINEIISTTVADADASHLDYVDFLSLMKCDVPDEDFSNTMKNVFKVLDGGAKGEVTAADLLKAFGTFGETISKEEAEELMVEAGKSKTGGLKFDEFVKLMRTQPGFKF